jgi:hypothetical protein
VADFLLFVGGDIVIVDEKEGVSARNSFGVGSGSRTNSLAQSSELVGIGSAPHCLVAGISTELAMLEELPVEESSTESASDMSSRDNAWQRPANPDTSVGGMALQRPAKLIGSTGDQMVLAVGIW